MYIVYITNVTLPQFSVLIFLLQCAALVAVLAVAAAKPSVGYSYATPYSSAYSVPAAYGVAPSYSAYGVAPSYSAYGVAPSYSAYSAPTVYSAAQSVYPAAHSVYPAAHSVYSPSVYSAPVVAKTYAAAPYSTYAAGPVASYAAGPVASYASAPVATYAASPVAQAYSAYSTYPAYSGYSSGYSAPLTYGSTYGELPLWKKKWIDYYRLTLWMFDKNKS